MADIEKLRKRLAEAEAEASPPPETDGRPPGEASGGGRGVGMTADPAELWLKLRQLAHRRGRCGRCGARPIDLKEVPGEDGWVTFEPVIPHAEDCEGGSDYRIRWR